MPLPPGSRGLIAGSSVGRSSRSRNQFFDRLVASRFRSKNEIGRLLRHEEEARTGAAAAASKSKPDANYYLTGVHKGVYYRIKLPPQEQSLLSRIALPTVPQIPSSSPLSLQPHAFKKIPASSTASSHQHGHQQQQHPHHPHPHYHAHPATVVAASGATGGSLNDFWWRLQEWWKENWTIVVLNVGSIFSLIGFTRSDVLELRCFSMSGSMAAIVYNTFQKPLRWSPILWSGTFAIVNGVKIVQILQERNSTVQMTNEQQSMYNQFFMPHGITPKQFERIYNKAEMIHIPKGDCLIRKGDRLEYVYLIVDGWTRANILGRYLTAGSFEPPAVTHKPGGSSGAWIGEIAFLESYWNKEQTGPKRKSTEEDDDKKGYIVSKEGKPEKLESNTGAATRSEQDLTKTAAHMSNNDKNLSDKVEQQQHHLSLNASEKSPAKVNLAKRATECLYTIVAKEDTTVLRWSHADMEQLLESSSDLRASLTRAMTAAMAAKVIQFTLSRSNAFPTSWSAWLDDWKHTAPQPVDPFNNARGDTVVRTIFSPKQDDETLANDDREEVLAAESRQQ